MVDESDIDLNHLFQTLADWEDILKDVQDVYQPTPEGPVVQGPKVG